MHFFENQLKLVCFIHFFLLLSLYTCWCSLPPQVLSLCDISFFFFFFGALGNFRTNVDDFKFWVLILGAKREKQISYGKWKYGKCIKYCSYLNYPNLEIQLKRLYQTLKYNSAVEWQYLEILPFRVFMWFYIFHMFSIFW